MEVNLGQITGVWIENTEPPHENLIWIKTINQNTGEKAAFAWNGIEWINLQGEGFGWKGLFDLQVNYNKKDVVLFNKALYIKLTDIVNNIDNPTVNTDFQLFLPPSVDGINGTNGVSAYQIWLQNGNTGTEQNRTFLLA